MPVPRSVKIHIKGLVQGVGFRPFVYKLAEKFGVKGNVQNSGEGLLIKAESHDHVVDLFIQALKKDSPPMSKIDRFELHETQWKGFESFDIVHSATDLKSTAVSPDMGICEKCIDELKDPNNRRYKYWAINCTDCGPRYSITHTIPYDRVNTSMKSFQMCRACEMEYNDPLSRRYHAQPISCFKCGPRLRLFDAKGVERAEDEEALHSAVQGLKEGKIIAVKGIGGFHLICDATDDTAVQELRRRKHRPDQPFAVMFKDMEHLQANAILTEYEKTQVLSKEKPIVLVQPRKDNSISSSVAPSVKQLGVFLPYTPLHIRLFNDLDIPLVVSSANLSKSPIFTDAKSFFDSVEAMADLILDHDRKIVNAVDDSVVQVINDSSMVLRHGRGLSPRTITLPKKISKSILSLGANQKSMIALAFEDKLVLSPYIGDLESLENFEYFERTIETFKRFYDFDPDLIMHDQHPEYFTSRWAKGQDVTTEALQHHHTHILACMAEEGLTEPVLGFSFDGTGYGEDGSIWGGEVMISDLKCYERIASFLSFRLIGGDKAVKEPRRIGLALLFECFDLKDILALDNPTVQAFSKEEIIVLHKVWEKKINAPLCSSAGRMFDGIASLCGLVQKISYEGESGMRLEAMYVASSKVDPFSFELSSGRIDWRAMIKEIVKEEDPRRIIAGFYHTMFKIIDELAQLHTGLPLVLSGGVFQNKTLSEMLLAHFKEQDRVCFIQKSTPVNDGGIALGQAWYAIHKE